MSMTGYYIALNDIQMHKFKRGQLNLRDIDSPLKLNIEKSWQALHYMLCGVLEDGDEPFGLVVPIRAANKVETFQNANTFLLSASQLRLAYEAIEDFDKGLLLNLYNYEKIVEFVPYPVIKGSGAKDFFEYLYDMFEEIRDYFEEVSDRGFGVLFVVD